MCLLVSLIFVSCKKQKTDNPPAQVDQVTVGDSVKEAVTKEKVQEDSIKNQREYSPIYSRIDALSHLFRDKNLSWKDSVSIVLNQCMEKDEIIYSNGKPESPFEKFYFENDEVSEIKQISFGNDERILFLSVSYFTKKEKVKRLLSIWRWEKEKWEFHTQIKLEPDKTLTLGSELKKVDLNFDGEEDLLISNSIFSMSRDILEHRCFVRRKGNFSYAPGLTFISSHQYSINPNKKMLCSKSDGGNFSGGKIIYSMKNNTWYEYKNEWWVSDFKDSVEYLKVHQYKYGKKIREFEVPSADWKEKEFINTDGFIEIE